MKTGCPLILASASPRRELLLKQAGYEFEVIPSQVDESHIEVSGLDCRQAAERLALAKARDVAALHPHRPVLAADTVVDADGQLIGKPADAADAEAILRRLFGKPHKVVTAVAFIWKSRQTEEVESQITWVYPRMLTEEQIADYIAGGSWHGKAGAYGIQETNDAFVDRIDGSFTNVVGLPMERVNSILKRAGIYPLAGRKPAPESA